MARLGSVASLIKYFIKHTIMQDRQESLIRCAAVIEQHINALIAYGCASGQISKDLDYLQSRIDLYRKNAQDLGSFGLSQLCIEAKVSMIQKFCDEHGLQYKYASERADGREICLGATRTCAKDIDEFLTVKGILHTKPTYWECINSITTHIY